MNISDFIHNRLNTCSKSNAPLDATISAINDAFEVSKSNRFKLEFIRDSIDEVTIRAIDSKDNQYVGIRWKVSEPQFPNIIIDQYTDWGKVQDKPERSTKVKSGLEVKTYFIEEFKSLEETLEVGAENGAY